MGEATGVSRRRFMGGLAATAGFMIVPRRVLGGAGFVAPSDTLNIAAVGAGGRGRSDINGCSHENIMALCDVDWQRAASTFEQFPQAKRYKDFREMLDKENEISSSVRRSTCRPSRRR